MSRPVSKAMVVCAHMDDEVLSCGGTIARHVAHGDDVTVCVLANRSYGHEYDADAVHAEINDCLEAQKILGYQRFLYYGQPDERLGERLVAVIADIERAAADVSPDIVYLPWKGDLHQDHRATFDATMVAFRPYAPNAPVKLLAYESASASPFLGPFAPNCYVDIAAHLETKIAALNRYRREAREWPHPRSGDGIIAKARQRGSEVGLEAAEAFMMIRSVVR